MGGNQTFEDKGIMRKYLAVFAVLFLVLAFSNSAPGTMKVEGAGGHLGGGGHDFGPFDPRMIPVESQAWWGRYPGRPG